MIADLKTFIEREKPFWQELEKELVKLREGLADLSDLKHTRHVLSLFQRASSDLVRIQGYSAEPELKGYLERLVGDGYAEIHSANRDVRHFKPWQWFTQTFPQTFRRQIWGWNMAMVLTLCGGLIGTILVATGQEGREVVFSAFPYHAESTPSERVAREEEEGALKDNMAGSKSAFSAHLMQNNIGVSLKALALGITWGVATVIILFYNGCILGGIIFDFVADGQIVFMIGWLLPHGSVEIPAILLGGQGGLVLGRALIGWGTSDTLRTRFRKIVPDLATLAGGAAILLIWAGLIESFLSQYHEPVIPYAAKIAFGVAQLLALFWFLYFCARNPKQGGKPAS